MKTHCQICGREIKANTGVIAHHGYERPGDGWQTSSCLGARYKPYEESRDRIPFVIERFKEWRESRLHQRDEMLQNPPEKLFRFRGYTKIERDRPEGFSPGEQHPSSNLNTYEGMFHNLLKNLVAEAAALDRNIEHLEKRHEEWVGR